MSAAAQTNFVFKAQLTKREAIQAFFEENIEHEYSSREMHYVYGSSFRTRVSEINRDSSAPITIKNRVTFQDGVEQSVYWAERREQ